MSQSSPPSYLTITQPNPPDELKPLTRTIGPTIKALHKGAFSVYQTAGSLSPQLTITYLTIESSAVKLCKNLQYLITEIWKQDNIDSNNNNSNLSDQFMLGFDLQIRQLPYTGRDPINDTELTLMKEMYVDIFNHKKITNMAKGKAHRVVMKYIRDALAVEIMKKLEMKYGYVMPVSNESYVSNLLTLAVTLYYDRLKAFTPVANDGGNSKKKKKKKLSLVRNAIPR